MGPTLAVDLERDRLEHRIRRTREALRALEHRDVMRPARGTAPVPRPLVLAVQDFRGELERLERRARQLDGACDTA